MRVCLGLMAWVIPWGLVRAGEQVGRSGPGPEMPFSALRDWQYYNNTGWMAYNRGNDTRAAQAFRLAVETVRPYQQRERVLMARACADYARVLYRQKRYAEAEPLATWALSAREEQRGVTSEQLSETLLLVARIHRGNSQHARAEPLLKRAVEVVEKDRGAAHDGLTPLVEELAEVEMEQGKVGPAELHFRRALAIREANNEANAREAEDLERAAMLLRQISPTGALSTTTLQQLERLEGQAQTKRERSAESPGAVAATERYATMLRKAGRANEADDLDAKARALRDRLETRAARAGLRPRTP